MNLLKNIFSVDAKQEHIVLRIFGIKFSIKKAKCKLHFKTFRDLSNVIRENIIKLPSDIDIVVGIPRSGIIPAYMIALFMNKDVCSLDEFINGITPHRGERPAYPPHLQILMKKGNKRF